MGYEKTVNPRLRRLFQAFAKGFPISNEVPYNQALAWSAEEEDGHPHTPDGKRVDQTSPNHRKEAWYGEAIRAAVWGTKEQLERALEAVFHSLVLELEQIGLWTREQTCPTPHGGLHLGGDVGLRVLVNVLGHPPELTAKMNELWARLGCVLAACATPGGAVWMTGERCPDRPVSEQASAVWREIMGLQQQRKLRGEVKVEDLDFQSALVGTRALIAKGDTFRGVREALDERACLPLLKRRMRVHRWKGGHLAVLLDPGGDVGDVCDWVLVSHDRNDLAVKWRTEGYTYSKGFVKPPPLDQVPLRDVRVYESTVRP